MRIKTMRNKTMKIRMYLLSLSLLCSVLIAVNSWGAGPDESEKIVDYLFVQNSQEVSLNDNVLTLKGVASDTLYFSDRPDRIVGRVTTKEFVDSWTKGHDSFKKDPPNAVLSVLHGSELQDIVVVLKTPRLTGADLVYDVEVLDGEKAVAGGVSSLFIDVIGRPLTPLSYAGVARRTSRRTVRRVERRH
jgi:hypothetical protein